MTPQVKRSNKNKILSKIVVFFLILTIVAILVITNFAIAKTTITINSGNESTSNTVLVEVLPQGATDVPEDSIRGQILESDFDISVSVPTSQTVVNADRAGGYVTIYNNYSKDQSLVATTRLLTSDGKLYRINDRVNVAAGETAQVWAQADKEGPDYVIGPTKFTIPGLWVGLQDKIYAESKDGMKLESVPRNVVTEENLNDAEQKISQQASIRALDTFNAGLNDNLKLNDSKIMLSFETLEASKVGAETAEATMLQKVHATGLVFDENDLINSAKEKFLKELGNKQSLAQFSNDYSYDIVEINNDTKKSVVEVKLTASVKAKDNLDKIDKSKITGQNAESIDSYLRSEGFDDFQIDFFPFWMKKAPKFSDHVVIQ